MLKIINHIIAILGLTFTLLSAGVDQTGYLSVKVEDGMEIFVDTSYVGKHSFSYMKLPVGEYTIHVYNPHSLDWSERGTSRNITVTENDYVSLDFTTEDQIKIFSLPIGSKAYSDGILIGTTPLTFNRDLLGSISIKLQKKGYEEASFNISPDLDEYRFILNAEAGDDQLKVARISNGGNQIKWYREGLVVTSLLSSWASFYFKRQADQSFAKYQRSSDSREMVKLYSETQKYDTLAEIAIAVSVATLGTYFYMLLTE